MRGRGKLATQTRWRRSKGSSVLPRYRHCYVRAIVEALVPTSAASHHRDARACSHIHSDARR